MNARNSTLVTTVFWLLATIPGTALAQDPADCTGDAEFGRLVHEIIETSTGRLYAISENGVYWSCDRGITWSGDGQYIRPWAIIEDPTDPTKVIVGTNLDASGTSIGDLTEVAYALASDSNGKLFVGTDSGVWESHDNGAHWTLLEGSGVWGHVSVLFVDPRNDLNILAGSSADGAIRSIDGGLTWETVSGLSGKIRDIVVDPANSSVFYAAAEMLLMRSSDAGLTWSNVGQIGPVDIAFDPGNPQKVYMTTTGSNFGYSVDGGDTWRFLYDEWSFYRIYPHSVHVLANGRVIVGTTEGGMFYSNDGGSTFIPSVAADPNAPPPADDEPSSGLTDLYIDFQFHGSNDTVDAGQNIRFTVTVWNFGPDDSTDTVIDLSWSNDDPSSALFQPYTSSSNNPLCCNGFTLPANESVTIEFNGTTEAGNYADYILDVTVTNAQSPIEVNDYYWVTARTEIVCGLVACWEAPESGGGSAGIPFLLVLLGIAARRRMRAA